MRLNIAYTINNVNHYLAYVSIHSLLQNNKNNDIYLYLLYDELFEKSFFDEFLNFEKYSNCSEVNFLKIDSTKYESFNNYYGILYCLELPNLVEADKILYIHSSSIINENLKPLYSTDINDKVLAAPEYYYEWTYEAKYNSDFAFSNYTMLLNLDRMREKNYLQTLLSEEFIAKSKVYTKFEELHWLNLLLEDCKKLSPKYGYAERWYTRKQMNCSEELKADYEAFLNHKMQPSIIIYFGKKPYQRRCMHSYLMLWWKYARKTPIYEQKKYFKPKSLCDKIKDLATVKGRLRFKKEIENKDKVKKLLFTFKYVKPHWLGALVAFGLAIPIGCLDAVIALSLKPYMDVVMVEKNSQTSWYIPLLIVAFTSLQGVLNFISTYFNDWTIGKVSFDIKKALYNKLMYKGANFIDTKTSGEIQKRFNTDADKVCTGIFGGIKLIISRVFSSISLITVLIYNSWQLAIFAIIVLLCAIYPLTKMKDCIRSVTNESENSISTITTDYNELYGGSKIVKAFNLYGYLNKIFDKHLDSVFSLRMEISKKTGIISPIMHVIVSIGIGFTIGYGSHLITTGAITSGNFVSFITALVMLYTPIKGLGGSFRSIQTSILALERVMKNLSANEYMADKNNAKTLKGLRDSIEFENVNFEYVKNKPVLKDVNFTIKKGETFALVGNSGGGKSTIVNLLPRFYKLKSGSIKIDGVDISNYKINSLRDNISIVLQDNFLFGGTIRENILMGKLDATEDELREAVKNACLEEFIESLDEGLNTYIGEKGVLVSGGQKQRIAIARAFIKNAPIVILDEATSALDNESEAIVQQAIDNLMKDKTVFVIAHRLSTIQNADRIAVINQGKLVELGTHDELINIEGGQYRHLYEMQFKKELNPVTV